MSGAVKTNSGVLDTRFRSALRRVIEGGRLHAYVADADTNLEIASIMKRLDGEAALMFTSVKSFDMPIVGKFYVVDTPFGRIFRITPKGEWDLVVQDDGWPNGMKFHKDGRLRTPDLNLRLTR